MLTRFYHKIKRLQPGTALEVVIATNIKEFLPRLLRLAYTLLKERKEGDRVALAPGDVWFQAAILREWDDGIAFVFPPFHVAGNVGILGTALVGRHPAVLIPNPKDVNDLLRTIQKARPAVLPAVPTLYNAMLAHPAVRAGKVDFSSVKLCVSGSAPLLAETKRRFEQLTGGRIIEVYSLTEACMASVGTPVVGTYKEGAVGIPLPDVHLRIVDARRAAFRFGLARSKRSSRPTPPSPRSASRASRTPIRERP